MAISAKLVKELRDRTGVGMMDAKKALEAVGGDIDKAIDHLRETGKAKAAKKAGRVAAEGLAKTYFDGNTAVILEVNVETDFAARNDLFKETVDAIAQALLEAKPKDVEDALENAKVNGDSLKDYIDSRVAVIGENVSLRRFAIFEKGDGDFFGSYIHMGGQMAVLVTVQGADQETANNVALHVGGIAPEYISREDVPESVQEHEKSVYTQETLNEGKPEKIVPKIVEGRMHKFFSQVCLLEQDYLLDDSQTVGDYVKSKGGQVTAMARYKVGEGIEKKEEDFAAEVAKEMNKD